MCGAKEAVQSTCRKRAADSGNEKVTCGSKRQDPGYGESLKAEFDGFFVPLVDSLFNPLLFTPYPNPT
jgi:hypothetical protein